MAGLFRGARRGSAHSHWVRNAIGVVVVAGLVAGGLSGPLPSAKAEPKPPVGPEIANVPEAEAGSPNAPQGMSSAKRVSKEEAAASLVGESSSDGARELHVPKGDFKNVPPGAGVERPRVSRSKSFDPETSEVVEQDATSQLFENADGTYTRVVTQDPERVRGSDGQWHAIDLTLAPDGEYLRPRVPLLGVSIRKHVGESLATINFSGDESVTLGLVKSAAGRTARTAEDRPKVAHFDNVRDDGVDVALRPTRHGLKTTYTVPTAAAAAAVLSETLKLPPGWTAQQETDAIVLRDRDGRARATWQGGPAFDSAETPANAMATMRLVGQTGRVATAEVTLPAGWATAPERVYPLTIDPSVHDGFTNNPTWGMDTYVRSDQPTTAGSTSPPKLYVGKSGTTAFRSLLRFNLPSAGNDVGIMDAYMALDRVGGDPCGSDQLFADRATSTWSSGSYWNNQPSLAYDDRGFENYCQGGEEIVQIDDMVQNWVNYGTSSPGGGADNIGVMLHTDEATTDYIEFGSAESTNSLQVPRLFVQYSHRPGQSQMISPGADAKIGSTTPRLTSTSVTDPDSEAVFYNFRIATGSDAESGMLVNSGWISNTYFDVPAGALLDGTTYYWHVQTYDGNVIRSGAAARKFQVDLRLGSASVSPIDSMGPVSVNLATGNLHTSTALRSASAVGGSLGLALNYNSKAESNFGLKGEYYFDSDQSRTFNEPVAYTRRDPVPSYWWGLDQPTPVIPADNFMVKWSGYVTVPTSAWWELGLRHDDGVRIKVTPSGGSQQTVLDHWDTTHNATGDPDWGTGVYLTQGVRNWIEIEFFEATGGAAIELWARSGAINLIVPTQWLTVDDAPMPAGWSLSADIDDANAYLTARDNGTSVTLTAADGTTSEFRLVNGAYVAPPEDDGTLFRDSNTNLLHIRAGDGRTYSFDKDGNLTGAASSADDRSPASFTYEYSNLGTTSMRRLTKITDPLTGRYLQLAYNTGGSYTSSCSGTPSGMNTAQLGALDYVDLVAPSPYASTSRLGCFFYYPADSWGLGQLGRIDELGGEKSTFEYQPGPHRLERITDPLNNDFAANGFSGAGKTVIEYDSVGRATSVAQPLPDGVAPAPKHIYTYTPGSPSNTKVDIEGITTANGYFRKVEYDESNRTTKEYATDGTATTTTWNSKDQVTSVTNAAGIRTTTIYDWADRPTDTYGPADSSCFNSSNLPNGTCTPTVPHSLTAYDENIRGLAVAYYANRHLAGIPTWHGTGLGATDGTVDAYWAGSPATGVPSDQWSLSATGDIVLNNTGTYTFEAYVDDGFRLYVDDKLVIDKWTVTGAGWQSGTFPNTTTGHKRIRLELWDDTSQAEVELWYKLPGSGTSIRVPGTDLSPKYNLITSTTDADNKVTRTEFAEPELGLPTATIVDPSGENLRTEITYETRSTADTYLRQKTKTLPAGTATGTAGDYTTQYDHYAKMQTVDNPCTTTVGDMVPQSGLPRLTTDADPDFAPGGSAPVTNETVYDYPWGRPIATRVNTDQWACTTYDTRGRVATRKDANTPTRVETYTYTDPATNNPLVSTYQYTDTGGTVRNTSSSIDLAGRPVKYADELSTIFTTEYDRASRPTKTYRKFFGGSDTLLTETSYLTNGRVDWTKEYASGVARQTNYSYDSYGRPTTTGPANGVSATSGYDANSGAVNSITYASSSGPVSKWTYQRSGAGRITSEAGQARTRNFSYDGVGRLTNVTEGSVQRKYKYDRNTNRCANAATCDGSFTYDNADRITSSPYATSYTYDPHGNITAIGQTGSTSNALSDSYSFDAAASMTPHSVPFTVGKSGPISATATVTPTSAATLTGSASPSLPSPNSYNATTVPTPGAAETTATVTWPQSDGTLNSSTTWNLTTAGYTSAAFTPNTAGTVQAGLTWASLNRTFAESGPTLTNTTPWTKNYVASANGQFKINLSWPWQAFSSPDLKLELLDGATVVATSNTSFYGNERETIDYTVSGLSGGSTRTYTVRITKLSGASTAFTIGNGLLGNPSQYPVTPTVGLELRNNATNALVTSASSGTGSVNIAGSTVGSTAYKFVATTTDNVSASQTQSIPNRAYAPLKIEFRPPGGGTPLWSVPSNSTGSVSMPAQFVSAGGNYEIQLTNMSTSAATNSASPTVAWTRVLRAGLGKEGSLAASSFTEQTVTAGGNGTIRVDTTWLKNTHDASYPSVTVEIKTSGGAQLATTSPSTTGSSSVSYSSAVSGTSYKVVVTNNSSTQQVPSFRTVTALPASAGITAKVLNANGDVVLNGNGGPAAVTVTGNLPPGKYQYVTTPTSGVGSVAVSGTFVPRSSSVTFGYDMASDHNVWMDDGVNRVTETLSPSGRVLRRVVSGTLGAGPVTEDITYGYDDSGDSPAYSKPTGGGSLTTYLGDAIDVAGVVTYRHSNIHGDIIGTSTSTGVFTERPAPDEYGLESVAPADRMGWLGKQQRMQTGINNLTRMGVRLYDPTTGRFLSVDPVDGGNANAYDYCSGDPVNCFDLDGHWGWSNVKKFWKKHNGKIKIGLAIAGGFACTLCVAAAYAGAGLSAIDTLSAIRSHDYRGAALGALDLAAFGYGLKVAKGLKGANATVSAMSGKVARMARTGRRYSKLGIYEAAVARADTLKLVGATLSTGGVANQMYQSGR